MTGSPPDLVQRAAARLTKAAQVEPVFDSPRQQIPATFQPHPDPAREIAGEASVLHDDPARKPPDAQHALPEMESRSQRVVAVSPTSLAARGIILPSSGISRTVEEFRALKRNVLANVLLDRTRSGSERVVLVTSANPAEGKTFVAINLALSLAYERDTKVLLMDADAYRRSCVSYLGISAELGWIDHLVDPSLTLEALVLQTNISGLSVLPSGKQRNEIPELMSSQSMMALLKALISSHPNRMIIIDALPCLASAEPAILAGLSGQTIFVVAAHETSHADVEASLRLLSASPNVSLVLNKSEPGLSEQFKGYGYYGYSHQQQTAKAG